MNKKQDIVPVQLKDDQKKYQQQSTNRFTQKLVALLKCVDSELLIWGWEKTQSQYKKPPIYCEK